MRSLIMFMRYPENGKVKTRLARCYGDDFVTALYGYFIDDLLERLKGKNFLLFLAYHPPGKQREMAQRYGDAVICFPQKGADLGKKMENAFIGMFERGFGPVILIGSDIPDLPAAYVDEAFCRLDGFCDIVIGPSCDGGYYLIGFKDGSFVRDVFSGIPWGSGAVLEETVKRVAAGGGHMERLPCWRDIDRPEDLQDFIRRNRGKDWAAPETMAFLMKEGLLAV